MKKDALHISPEVQEALANGKPVVALESTIIAHGMPYPANEETARAVEGIVRAAGAIPATIAILHGDIKVGLSADDLHLLATSKEVLKAGERDIPLVVAKRLHAATTAGSSIAIAASAGIPVFVTGGIGGVARMAAESFDISADLLAIAGYTCITVCAGSKAFMDIPATLEYLETQRVPVMVYQAEHFPMFYSRSSGVKVDWVAHTPDDVASAFAAKLRLGIEGGMLVGVPIPTAAELPLATAEKAISSALEQIKARGITGKAVTPFLLSAIKESTDGESLEANIALIRNNAQAGAEIAVALAKHRQA